jgi:HEAT repeat protein
MFKALRVDQLISDLGDPKKHHQAARILVSLGRFILSDLIRGMENQDEEILFSIAGIIYQIGSPAVEPLIRELEAKPDPACQRIMIEILGELGDSRATEPLLDILETDDPTLFEEAQVALCNIYNRQCRSFFQSNLPVYNPG